MRHHYTLFEKFLSKNSFWQNSNVFTSFSLNFFLTIFPVKSKLSTAKKSKITTFHEFFTQKKSTLFLTKSKLNFWTKNEDFEQCADSDLREGNSTDSIEFVNLRFNTTASSLEFRPHTFLLVPDAINFQFKVWVGLPITGSTFIATMWQTPDIVMVWQQLKWAG